MAIKLLLKDQNWSLIKKGGVMFLKVVLYKAEVIGQLIGMKKTVKMMVVIQKSEI
jgi:hypothetical protein